MSDLSFLLPGDGGGQPPLVEGVVVKAPAATTDYIFVSIPDFNEQDLGGLRWMARGATLPQVGDSCLVAFSNTGTAWVVAWWH